MSQPQPQQPVDHHREPCPDRIVDDVGGAFAMGAIGGGLFHGCRALIWGPKNFKLRHALETVRKNGPTMGGSFAVWGGLFSGFDCTLVYLRQKEDPWNSIASAAMTGGFLSARMGPQAAARAAFFGAVILAAIEGIGIMLQKNSAPPPAGMPMQFPEPARPETVLVGGAGGPGGAIPGDFAGPDAGSLPADEGKSTSEGGRGWFGSNLFSSQ